MEDAAVGDPPRRALAPPGRHAGAVGVAELHRIQSLMRRVVDRSVLCWGNSTAARWLPASQPRPHGCCRQDQQQPAFLADKVCCTVTHRCCLTATTRMRTQIPAAPPPRARRWAPTPWRSWPAPAVASCSRCSSASFYTSRVCTLELYSNFQSKVLLIPCGIAQVGLAFCEQCAAQTKKR